MATLNLSKLATLDLTTPETTDLVALDAVSTAAWGSGTLTIATSPSYTHTITAGGGGGGGTGMTRGGAGGAGTVFVTGGSGYVTYGSSTVAYAMPPSPITYWGHAPVDVTLLTRMVEEFPGTEVSLEWDMTINGLIARAIHPDGERLAKTALITDAEISAGRSIIHIAMDVETRLHDWLAADPCKASNKSYMDWS
jgi:hypothetical protein